MRRTLVAALTGAMVVGVSATSFAANPFTDVPSGHWAYDAVTRLAEDGIIEGYGDDTFRGQRNITRYEMAQMVAKAMARMQQIMEEMVEEAVDDHVADLHDGSEIGIDMGDIDDRIDEKIDERLSNYKPDYTPTPRVEVENPDLIGGASLIKISEDSLSNGRLTQRERDILNDYINSQGRNFVPNKAANFRERCADIYAEIGEFENALLKSDLTDDQKDYVQRQVDVLRLNLLSNEFRDELISLGVRVDELERHADMVKWTGKIEYTYGNLRSKNKSAGYTAGGAYSPSGDKASNGSNHTAVFRLEPSAEVAKHWTANARFDANVNFGTDSTDDVKLKRIFAQGDYGKFGIKLGRIGYCPAVEDGLVMDTVLSGGELTFGSKWKAIVTAGRIGGGDEPEYAGADWRDGGTNDDETDVISLNLQYNGGGSGLYGGASYYYAEDDDFRTGLTETLQTGKVIGIPYKKGNPTNKANIWGANIGYKMGDFVNIYGSYAQNTKADFEDKAYAADIRFGKYGDYANQGDWAVWGGYAKFAANVGIGSNQGDDVQTGTKGWHVGAAYAPFKNVGVMARYSDGKYITGGDKYRKVFARAEFFF